VIGRGGAGRNRDIALTTLIDLLVQVIFVFTLILISADVIEGGPKERGWITPEVWKTLISIFDVDPRTVRDAGAQVSAIRDTFDGVKDDLERVKHELLACDAKSTACEKQAGRGPGYGPCRSEAGTELVVAKATIDLQGRITVAPGRDAAALQTRQPLSLDAIGTPLTVAEFASLFRPWRQHGLGLQPACAYKAELEYDPRAPAGSYEPARRAIASYFTLSAPPRRF
jgi:hypothetical protein